MCRTLASALAVTGLQVLATGTIDGGKVVPDGTNVWIGAATGGMADPRPLIPAATVRDVGGRSCHGSTKRRSVSLGRLFSKYGQPSGVHLSSCSRVGRAAGGKAVSWLWKNMKSRPSADVKTSPL